MYITDASGFASSNVLIYEKYTYYSYFVVDDLIHAFLKVLRAVYGQNHVNAAFKNRIRITYKRLVLNLNFKYGHLNTMNNDELILLPIS